MVTPPPVVPGLLPLSRTPEFLLIIAFHHGELQHLDRLEFFAEVIEFYRVLPSSMKSLVPLSSLA